jgi:putative DNA primase/helicase
LLGWNVTRRRVLYFDGEFSGPTLQKRLLLFEPKTKGYLTVLTPDLWHLRQKMMPNLADEATRTWLDAQIEKGKYDVVILDSLSTLIRGAEENDATAWEPIQHWILQHRGHGRAIIFLHHQGRSRMPRGTSKREDIVETVIGLRKDYDLSTDTDSAFQLSFDKSREFYGKQAQPMLIRLSTQTGHVEWSHELMRDLTRDKVQELWKAGVKQKEIAKEVGLSQPRVSQIIMELRKELGSQEDGNASKKKIRV